MDFTGLQTEFFARGFEYLNDAGAGLTRAKRWINEAYHEIADNDDWPFMEATNSAVAPITFTDLRKVSSVFDTTDGIQLSPASRKVLADSYENLALVGTPVYWYLENAILKTYPVKAAPPTLSVYYWKFATDLSAGADLALVPARYHDLIIQGAVVRALMDSDEPELAQSNEKLRKDELEDMRRALLDQYPSGARVNPRREDGGR